MSSYDVRIWSIREHKGKDRATGKPRSTYRVRWAVAGKDCGESFQTKALAESFRSKLITAQREGIAFDEATGLPEPMARELNSRTWYEHALAFVDMKWPRASAKHRKGIAESLATVTPALLASERGRPTDREIRAALYGWSFNKARRDAGAPPGELAPAVAWLAANTIKLSTLVDEPSRVRRALDALTVGIKGKNAAPSTVARKRAIFSGALRYAVELRLIDHHPLDRIKWTVPKRADGVDRGVVINPRQAAALLARVRDSMPELEAFFGCLYYAALRPEEALHLRAEEYERPAVPGGWGWLHLSGATVTVGNGWGDQEGVIENRGLKHRAKSATRDVPAAPPLCALLDSHLDEYGAGPEGRLFVTRRGPGGMLIPGRPRPVPNNAYTTAWRKAREKALTPPQYRSALGRRPYDLRHAAVSTWLNAGVPAPQVAEWAGHSVHVLLKVYAKCIDGQEEAARRRIERALGLPDRQTDEASGEPAAAA
jgi:integrase